MSLDACNIACQLKRQLVEGVDADAARRLAKLAELLIPMEQEAWRDIARADLCGNDFDAGYYRGVAYTLDRILGDQTDLDVWIRRALSG